MNPTLVLLAAGIGSRYGGLKQLEAVGPAGATIMDYSILDALRAGFDKVVLVIRPETEELFQSSLERRWGPRIPIEYVHQTLDRLPPGYSVPRDRTKPWGTGHALLVTRDAVRGPFAVANADDFYGRNAFDALGEFLARDQGDGVPTFAMVAYRLRDTLSDAGSVSRGVCRATPDGWLEEVVETLKIEREGDDARFLDEDGNWRPLSGDTRVSMNLWGFTPAMFDELERAFTGFLARSGDDPKAELFLPEVVQQAMAAGRARVRVLARGETWCGMTNPQDKARAAETIRGLVERGVYPQVLWE